MLEGLEQRRVDSEQSPGTLYHAGHVATSTRHGDDFFVEASLDGLGKVVTTLHDHFETRRLAVVGPGRDSDTLGGTQKLLHVVC